MARLPSPISVAFTVAGYAPLLVGWLKLKANGGGVVRVIVEVVTVDPLVLVVHTPLLGVTVCAPTGQARQPAEIAQREARLRMFRGIRSGNNVFTESQYWLKQRTNWLPLEIGRQLISLGAYHAWLGSLSINPSC